jgi:hypothetical protein
MEIRQAIKDMGTLDLILLRAHLGKSKEESDIEFRKEIDAELKIRNEEK